MFIRQTHSKSNHIGNIFGLYVKKAYRGKGIGGQLIDEALRKFKMHGQVRKTKLAVNTDLVSAVKLYERLGFHRVGILKEELQYDGRFYDELVMEKILKE